MDSQNH